MQLGDESLRKLGRGRLLFLQARQDNAVQRDDAKAQNALRKLGLLGVHGREGRQDLGAELDHGNGDVLRALEVELRFLGIDDGIGAVVDGGLDLAGLDLDLDRLGDAEDAALVARGGLVQADELLGQVIDRVQDVLGGALLKSDGARDDGGDGGEAGDKAGEHRRELHGCGGEVAERAEKWELDRAMPRKNVFRLGREGKINNRSASDIETEKGKESTMQRDQPDFKYCAVDPAQGSKFDDVDSRHCRVKRAADPSSQRGRGLLTIFLPLGQIIFGRKLHCSEWTDSPRPGFPRPSPRGTRGPRACEASISLEASSQRFLPTGNGFSAFSAEMSGEWLLLGHFLTVQRFKERIPWERSNRFQKYLEPSP